MEAIYHPGPHYIEMRPLKTSFVDARTDKTSTVQLRRGRRLKTICLCLTWRKLTVWGSESCWFLIFFFLYSICTCCWKLVRNFSGDIGIVFQIQKHTIEIHMYLVTFQCNQYNQWYHPLKADAEGLNSKSEVNEVAQKCTQLPFSKIPFTLYCPILPQ